MKLPKYGEDSSHTTGSLNTLTLTGISILWGVMLNLISPWWMILSTITLFAGYGNEIKKRDPHVRF